MRTIISLLCILTFVLGDNITIPNNDYIILSNDTFNDAIQQYDILVVLFYAPWCEHCHELEQYYPQFVEKLSAFGATFSIINAVENSDITIKYRVTAYPSIILFKDDDYLLYKGDYEYEYIVNWITKQIKGPFIEIVNITQSEDLINNHGQFVIYFGDNDTQIDIVKEETEKESKYLVGICKDKKIAQYYQASFNGLVLFKKHDEKRNDFKNEFTGNNINTFLLFNVLPSLIEFDGSEIEKYLGLCPGLFIFTESNIESLDLMNILNKILLSIKAKNVLTFNVNALQDKGQRLASLIGIKEQNYPQIFLIEAKTFIKKYQFNEGYTEENILQFIDKALKGELRPFLKSQPIPKEQEDIVYTLVGESFHKEVYDNDKDVIVQFYMSKFEDEESKGIYEDLAESLSHNDNMLVAKLDLFENDVDNMTLSFKSQIVIYPSKRKDNPISFEDEFTLENLMRFVQTYANNRFTFSDEDL